MSTIELDPKEWEALRKDLQITQPPITNEGVPIGAIELRRQYTTPNGEVVLVQALVEVKRTSVHAWNPNVRKWVPLTDYPDENPPGAALHPDEHGPGGYKPIES